MGEVSVIREWISSRVRSIEDLWFDATRSVETSGGARRIDASEIVGQIGDGVTYLPVRAANARAALRDLPISDFSQYTFLDMGSGKGRMLFLAAEHPFHRVQGVEFVVGLHEKAQDNIQRYSHRKQKCIDIESVNGDAAAFEFPSGSLVISLFNSFGPVVLKQMLANLDRSLEKHPRHVIVLLIYPKSSHVLAGIERWHIYTQNRRYHIYQNLDR